MFAGVVVGRVARLRAGREVAEVVDMVLRDDETIRERGLALFIFVQSSLDDQPLTQTKRGAVLY